MGKLKLKYILISCFLFAALILVQHYSRKPTDWKMSFSYQSKSPYGCYVLNEMFPLLFQKNVEYNYQTAYDNPLLEDADEKNLIIITAGFDPGEAEVSAIFEFVEKGNNAFIAAHSFPEGFLDSLSLSLSKKLIDTTFWTRGEDSLNFFNPEIRKDTGYILRSMMIKPELEPEKGFKGLLLGHGSAYRMNFVRCDYGKGHFFIHSNPLAFTNLQILYGDQEYAKTALLYLPDTDVIIDKYYKPFRKVNTSPTKFILSRSSLRTAFYLVLVALLIYMVFGSRRRQREIPVVEPLKNTSAEFIRTISRLYLKTNDHGNIAYKKTIYFKEFLRENYFISDISESEEDIRKIRSKTGVPENLIRRLLRKINYYSKPRTVSREALLAYHKDMEEFKKNCL